MTREELAVIGVTPEAVSALLNGEQAAAFLAEKGAQALGFAMARADVADIFALFVRPEAQGAGLGARLLAEAEHWLAGKDVSLAWLATDAESPAVTFYKRHEWREESRTADRQIVSSSAWQRRRGRRALFINLKACRQGTYRGNLV